MKIHIFFSLLLFMVSVSGQTSPMNSKSEQLDEFVKDRMKNFKIPGLALAVLQNGKIVKLSAYGTANVETQTPVTTKSVFTTASLSKQFTAMAILLLEQDGKLALEDKAAKYIEGFPDAWKEITIRQLLTHTSGIVRDPLNYHPYKEQPITEVIKAMYNLPLNALPGEKWLYSNAGYYVLSEIISRTSGKSWDAFIAERIFAPAGLKDTRVYSATNIIPNRVSGYHNTPDGRVNAERWIAVRPSAAFFSTIEDLAKWDLFLDKENLLSKTNRELLWTAALLNNKQPTNYGLGWYVDSYLGRTRIHHDGQYPGFRASYEKFPEENLSVIVLANSDNARLDSTAVKIAGFYKSTLAGPPFSITVKISPSPATVGNLINFEIKARNDGQNAAPQTVLEMEIWSSPGKVVYKQSKTNVDYAAGETQTYNFSWTPEKAGEYTVNIGTFGPRWIPDYTWKENLMTLTVN